MWTRKMMLPLVVLIGAGIIDGAVLGGTRLAGWSLSAWPVVGGLAALLIAALSDQAHAIADEGAGEAEDLLSAVARQNTLIAAGLVIAGLAVLLGAFAPRSGPGFATWAGLATVTMGFMLAVFKAAFARHRTYRETPRAGAMLRDEPAASYPAI